MGSGLFSSADLASETSIYRLYVRAETSVIARVVNLAGCSEVQAKVFGLLQNG